MRHFRVAALPVIAAVILAGAGVSGAWRTKKYADWTVADAHEVMTDSPWSKRKPMPAAGRPSVTVIESASAGVVTSGAAGASASLGNGANGTSGPAMTAGPPAAPTGTNEPGGGHNTTIIPSGMGGPAPAPELHPPITIFWASAAPVRLAILKLRSGNVVPDEQERARVTAERKHYVVAVSGLPTPEGEGDARQLAAKAMLKTKAHSPVTAVEADRRRIGDAYVYFFRFSRAALPLSAEDGTVEFRMKLGTMEVAQSFKLSEMQYEGRLAL